MSLDTIDLQDKKLIIIDFLQRCNVYSEQMLEGYEKKLEESSATSASEIQQKIYDWSIYRKFNEHAIGELDTDELDNWF